MSRTKLTVDLVKLSDRAAIMNLRGELTAAAGNSLADAYSRARNEGASCLILNCTELRYLDSPGVSLLAKLHVRASRELQHLAAFGLGDHCREVFSLTGLDKAISVYETEAEVFDAATALTGEKLYPEVERQAMDSLSGSPGEDDARILEHWARPVPRLSVSDMPVEAVNRNVDGRRPVGPLRGFGQMWEKTYQLRLVNNGVKPADVIKTLKEKLPKLQPPQNRFYPSPAGIQPGEIVLINASTPGGPVATGVLVSYADDECFTLMTPQGHPESGWVTFSAYEDDGYTTCQIQGLARANDPVYEVAFRLAGAKVQEQIWTHVLTSLADQLGVMGHVQKDKTCLATGLQWSEAKNVWYNAQMRTLFLYVPLAPLRWLRRRVQR